MTFLGALIDFFVNPLLLSGMALLAAPIVIHLLNKRRFEVVDWAAMEFLLDAQAQNRRRLRVEDLILLLLRMLLLALVVFAVARPLLQGGGGLQEDERTIVLDDSYSMESRGGTGSAFDVARAQAIERIEESVARGLEAEVWRGCSVKPLLSRRSEGQVGSEETGTGNYEEASRVLKELRVLGATDLRFQLPYVLTAVSQKIAAAAEPRARAIVVLSDFRRRDWFEADGKTLRGDLRRGLGDLSRANGEDPLRCHLVQVGRPDRENLAASEIRVDGDHPMAGVPVRLVVRVRNFGKDERKMIRGALEVGSPQPASMGGDQENVPVAAEVRAGGVLFQTVQRVPLPVISTIAPGETATTAVELLFDRPGMYPLVASIEGDSLRRDDATFAVVTVRESIHALVVDGDPGGGRFGGESGFVLAALRPRGEILSGITPRVHTLELTPESLLGTDVALILNRSSFSAYETQTLRQFVEQGGGLGLFLGNRVEPASYAEAFGAVASAPSASPAADGTANGGRRKLAGPARLLPARLESVKKAADLAAGRLRARIQVADWNHPAFALFRGIDGPSLEQVGFDRFYKLQAAEGATVVARFDDAEKTPAILEFSGLTSGKEATSTTLDPATEKPGADAGADGPLDSEAPATRLATAPPGRVALFNMTADRDWNDWPTDPSYPIVMQEWIRYLAPRASERRRVRAGEPLVWQAPPGLSYKVLTPEGRRIDIAGEAGVAVFSDTRIAGFYCVVPFASRDGLALDEELLKPMWFGVVRDELESDLTPTTETELRDALGDLGIAFTFSGHVEGAEAQGMSESGEGMEGTEMWRLCALGTGFLVFFELLVAWWFGRRSS